MNLLSFCIVQRKTPLFYRRKFAKKYVYLSSKNKRQTLRNRNRQKGYTKHEKKRATQIKRHWGNNPTKGKGQLEEYIDAFALAMMMPVWGKIRDFSRKNPRKINSRFFMFDKVVSDTTCWQNIWNKAEKNVRSEMKER